MNESKTFADLGWKGPFPDKLHLLPLCEPEKDVENAKYPPLHLLPDETYTRSRIAFTIKDKEGKKIDWIAKNHVFPAAYPRSHPQSVRDRFTKSIEPELSLKISEAKTNEELKTIRKKDLLLGKELIKTISLEQFIPPFNEEEVNERVNTLMKSKQPQLWCCVERLIPIRFEQEQCQQKEGKRIPLTLLFAHATGFHKEIWEPLMKSLIGSLENHSNSSGYFIEEVWSLDHFRSGDSALLNEPFLGPAISSHDSCRDIQQFIQFYLPPSNSINSTIPTTLSHQKLAGKARKTRKIIAIGHSAGAAAMTMAFITDTVNGESLNLVDGFISFDSAYHSKQMILQHPLPHLVFDSLNTIVRKDLFLTKQEILHYLKKAPMFKHFDERVREIYLNFGFRKKVILEGKESKEVFTMKMSKWSESFSFSQIWTNCFTSKEFEKTNFKGWIYSIYSDTITKSKNNLYLSAYKEYKTLCQIGQNDYQNNSKFTFQEFHVQHLFPLEKPEKLGKDLTNIIIAKMNNEDPNMATKSTSIKSICSSRL